MFELATDMGTFQLCVHIVMLMLCSLTLLSDALLVYLLLLTQKIHWSVKVSVINIAFGICVHASSRYDT